MHEAMKLQLSETKRVVAYYDYTNWTIEDVAGDGLKLQPINFCENYGTALSTNDNFRNDVARLVSAFHYYNHPGNYHELRERAVSLYFTTAGVPFKFVSLRGYNERADVVIYDNEPGGEWVLSKDSESALEAWFKGEIYTVTIEELEVYTNERNGATIENWEVVDSLGCCILEDLTLETVKDLFGPNVLELQAA